MYDNIYCYPNSNVLKNKYNVIDKTKLFMLETELTSIRLRELQNNNMKGDFDFAHLKAIHQYIFQDIYEWAGKERTVEIGKGNLFCTTACIPLYAKSVFNKYFSQCYANKDNIEDFIRVLAENYGDLNALHPFREGNGRAQREFARLVCLECGYLFDLSSVSHNDMLNASIISFNKGDSSSFVDVFTKAVSPHTNGTLSNSQHLRILTCDDLTIGMESNYDYYESNKHKDSALYDSIYKAKISKMDAEKEISEALNILKQNKVNEKKSEDYTIHKGKSR